MKIISLKHKKIPEVASASEGEQAYTPYLTLFSLSNSIFLFGTRRRIPIEKRLVKVEREADLDQDSGAIGTIEFLQKGRILIFAVSRE
jgi:hypothetical protein